MARVGRNTEYRRKGKGIELFHLTCSLANTPAKKHVETHVMLLAIFHGLGNIKGLHQCHHRHWRGHPKAESISTIRFLWIDFCFHLIFQRHHYATLIIRGIDISTLVPLHAYGVICPFIFRMSRKPLLVEFLELLMESLHASLKMHF